MAKLQHQAIALLLLFTATVSLLPTHGNARTLQGTYMRRLADAKADASSTGGTALSVSDSQGKSDVTTTSTASNGGTAVAVKSASNDASHLVSSAADGNSSFTYSSSTPHSKDDVWDSAPACRNSSTATFDASMRLWGWENNAPCAFKEEKTASGSSPTGTCTGSDDAWNNAPACKQADTSATKDNSGRLWGWENGASCAFKAPGNGGDAVWEAAKPCAAPAAGDNIKSTDNRGRKWGWENGASCAFKGTSSRKMLSIVDQLNSRAMHDTHPRQLLADAKADASSTGDIAVSVSDSQGKSDVTTTSTASNGGTAVAVKSASNDASHLVSSAADGNSSFTYSSSTPHSKGDAWDSAPPCKQADTSAAKDNSGRLWGWENGASCAFKAPGGGGDAVWEAAKPCAASVTADNVKGTDNRGRKWGWENGASCAFQSTASRKMLNYDDLNTRPAHGTHTRKLAANAKADASSTGGTALSVSDSQGKSDVTTTSTASNDGTAVAIKSASNDASHLVSSAADGNSSFTYSSSTPHSKGDAWDSALPCKQADTSATKDNNGRLWGWENGASCAFKAPGDGGDAVWEAAKPCAAPATADNVKGTDNRGRKWGWENSASCAFKGTAARKMLSNTDALNMPAGQMLVTDLSGGSDNTAADLLAADAAVPAEEYAEDGLADSSTTNLLPAADTPAEDYTVEEDPASDPASNSNITGPEAVNGAANAAIPAANSAASDLSAPAADPADNSSADINPAAPANTNAAADVPALDDEYDVAHTTTPDIIVGGVKGATDSFGKPITVEVPSADNATVTPPADATSASPTPAAAADITTASPAPATSPEPAAASPSPTAAPAASSAPTWETAPACVGPPTKQTSVQDLNGRLWWVVPSGSTWSSCTYRAADGTAVYYEGYQQVQFDSAPACQHLADTTNAMADSSGRLWGWEAGQAGDGANCRFLKADGTPVMLAEVFMV